MENQAHNAAEQATSNDGWYAYGAIYYAPSDSHVIVPRRSGLGSTVNFAQPGAYLVLSVPLVLGAILVLCVLLGTRW